MATSLTNKTKPAPVTTANKAKGTTTLSRKLKSGRSYTYGEPGYGYGDDVDSDVGSVGYGVVGSATSFINKPKN